MTLTKAQLIESIYNNCGYSKTKSTQLAEFILNTIKDTLSSGEDVLLSGFGKFCVNDKNSRRGRNPSTGNEMTLRPRRIVTFKCSQALRSKMNGNL